MKLIDTHVHLDLIEKMGKLSPAETLHRASDADVRRVVQIGVDLESSRRSIELAREFPGKVFASIGLHPEPDPRDECGSDGCRDPLADWDAFAELARSERDEIVAIGECGLDPTYETPMDVQREIFVRQIRLALELGKPVVVHVRKLFAETLDLLEAEGARDFVIHCFTGETKDAERIVRMGGYLGIGGIATFRSGEKIREALRAVVPVERILLETDAPFLAPEPHRGALNEPAMLPIIAARIGEIYDLTGAELGEIAARNAVKFFDLPGRE